MLGKHVNVSARNQKLMHKVLCVILAFVLIGLMVPHGLAAQLSAYAGNEAEQTPAAETQADNQEESTPAEEVNSDNNAQSNEGEPVAEPVENYEWSVTLTLSDGIYLDNESGGVATSISDPWSILTEDANSHVTALKATGTAETAENAPTYKDLLDQISMYCSAGDKKELAKGLPEGCSLGDFVYTKDKPGFHLNEHVTEGDDHNVEPLITTNIVINNTEMDPADPSPQLWYFIGSKSYVQRESWPTDTKVDYLQYNSQYEIDTENKLLKVTGAGEYGAHTVGAFTAKLDSDMYDSDGFSTEDTTGVISPNLAFTAHWKNKSATVHLASEPAGVVTEGTFFLKAEGATQFSTTTWEDKEATVGNTYQVLNPSEGYSGLLGIGENTYAFKFANPTVGLARYAFDKWQVSTDGTTYGDITAEGTIDDDVIYFKAVFKENKKLTFGVNTTQDNLKIKTAKNPALTNWTDVDAPIYYDDNYYYNKAQVNSSWMVRVGTNEGGTFVPVDYYQVNAPPLSTTIKFTGKWTANEDEITTDDKNIEEDLSIVANIQISLKFVFVPELATTVGHIETGSPAVKVSGLFAYPGAPITYDGNVATIDSKDYTAISDNPAYEFGNWPTSITEVPDTAGNFTVTFKEKSAVSFTIDVLEEFKEGITITETYGGSSHTVTPGTTEYFTEGSKYWKSADGKQLIIGTDTATATTHHVFTVALTNEHTHYNKWMVDNDEVPLMADAKELLNTIPHAAKLYIDVDAQVTFNISTPEGATADNCVIKLNGTAITPGTKYFYEPTAFTVNGKSLNIATSATTTDPFYADSDEHFQVFLQWQDDEGNPIADTGTLEYNQTYTFVASFEELELLTAKGTCEDRFSQTKLDAAGYVDVYFINKETHDKGNFYKSYPVTSTAAAGFTLQDQLPHNVHLYVNASAEGWISEDAEADMYNASIIDQPITLRFETDGALQFDKDGVSPEAETWVGDYGKKFDMDTVTKTEGGISVTPESTLTTTIKNSDKINLVDFTNYEDGVEPTTITATLTYQNGEGSTITKFATFQRQAFFDLSDTSDINGSTTGTIRFSGAKNITNIDVKNAPRNVFFTKDTTSKDGKFVNQEGAEVGQLSVATGYKFNRATSGDNKDKVVIKAPNDTVMFTISPKGIDTPGSETIFRAWTDTLTSDKDVVIVEDVTFIGKFVDKFLNVNFQPDTKSKKDVTVTGDGTGTSTVKVYNDSWFDPYDSPRTQKTGKTVTASFKYSESEHNEYVLTMDDESAVYYKFADLAFTYPTLPAEQDIVQVNENLLNENNILVVTYMVVDKEKCTLTADLDGGALAEGANFKDVPDTLGGNGPWTQNTEGNWENTFFEETYRNTIDEYMVHGKMDILRTEGFFSGEWTHETTNPDWVAAGKETWTAKYDDSALVTGKVETSKPAATPEAAADVIVELSNPDMEIAPGVHSVKGTTDANGAYSLKVYGSAKWSAYVTGKMTAGSQNYIEKDTQLVATDWSGEPGSESATKSFTGELALDKGYSFFASDIVTVGQWYAKYYEKKEGSPSIRSNGLGLPRDGEISLSGSSFFGFYTTAYLGKIDSGHEMVITTSTTSGNFNMTTFEIAQEDVEITGSKFVYTIWASETDLIVKNTEGEQAKKISRIDYRIPWEEYISIHGKVTEIDTSKTKKLDGIDVTYYPPAGSNAVVTSKTTFDGGNYYLIIPQGAGGKVMFVDPWNDPEQDDHLDERIRLDKDGKDTQQDITTQATSSGDTANPEMIPAIHVTGNVQIQDPVTHQYEDAVHADVSYSDYQAVDPSYDYEWNQDNHGYAFTDENGDYVLKLRKNASKDGGFVWFHMVGDDPAYAQDGHLLQKDGVSLTHDNDIDDINGWIDIAGAYVHITWDGFDTEDAIAYGFEVISYANGVEVDRYTIEGEAIDAKNFFSADGKIGTGYDDEGRHVLRYHYGENDDFVMTVRPLYIEGYTYWSWKLTDHTGSPTRTLSDVSDVELTPQTDNPYIFTVYATEGAELTASGSSEGHAMWDATLMITSGSAQETVTEHLQVPAGTDFKHTFPICNDVHANEITDDIHTEFYFDGEMFNLELTSMIDGSIPYKEHWVLDPVEAEGYYFVGMSMNNVEMVPGDLTNLTTQEDLNLVAHYLPIPEDVSGQTGDNNNMWWLVGLAVLAMLGVAYGASRKQKGVRC